MPHVNPAWLEHQRKRFTRENAYLYIRPDADRLLGPQARHLLPPNWRRPGDRYADRAASDAPETRAADVSEETEALRFRAEIAAIRFELALLKSARFFRKYSPDQPRVPAGNPDGGQWTRVGGSQSGNAMNADGQDTASENAGSEESVGNDFDLGALYAEAEAQGDGRVLSDATPDNEAIPGAQYAQARGGRGSGRSQFPEATPAQQARLAAVEGQADAAVRAVREIDPNWQRPPSLSSTIEGQIAAERAAASEARERVDLFQRLGITRDTLRPDAPSRAHEDILAPGGELIGEQYSGASEKVRTVGRVQFEQTRDELIAGSRPIATRLSYPGLWFERADGSRFGLRMSRDYGPTIDVFAGNIGRIPANLKVHQR